MISPAFSVVEIPAATQNPSMGRLSRRLSSQLDMISGAEGGAHETGLDGRWCHSHDHDGRFAK